jgi:hypothetical protein
MFGFTESERVHAGEFFTIWRTPTLVFMHVTGVIDDEHSARWQGALQAEYDRAGYPRFAAMEVSSVEPTNSMQSRFRSAQWIRGTLSKIEQGAVLTGARPGPLVVSRAVLRIVGLSNILLLTEPEQLQRTLDAYRAGHKA